MSHANVLAFAYGAAGRIATESLTTGGVAYAVGRSYDAAGRLSGIEHPDGSVATRGHTARGELAGVNHEGIPVAAFAYDAGGRETTRTFGNGLVTTTGYAEKRNLVASIANPAVGTYTYAYDANGNRTAETVSGVMAGYGWTTGPAGYDAEDRLVAWDRADGNRSLGWSLSAVGDWDSFTQNGAVETRTHGPAHELTAIGGTGTVLESISEFLFFITGIRDGT